MPAYSPITKEQFILTIAYVAVDEYKRSNVLPSLTIAQACLESGYGKHAPGNMLFGMKWSAGCGHDFQELWTKEYVNGHYVNVLAKFRKYRTWDDSITDHTDLLMTKRYEPVRKCKDYLCATEQIKKCGYATSPTYTESLRAIIKMYDLTKYDEMAVLGTADT